RCAGGDPADHRQAFLLGRRRFEAWNADAAGGPRSHLDRPLAGQGLEVFLGGVGRLEAQFLGDFRTGRRVAVVFQAALDEGEDFGLSRRQFEHAGGLSVYTGAVIIYSDCGLATVLFAEGRMAISSTCRVGGGFASSGLWLNA